MGDKAQKQMNQARISDEIKKESVIMPIQKVV